MIVELPTQEQALTYALWLAYTAPREEQKEKATALAESLAEDMLPRQIEAAEAEALDWAREDWAEDQ